jgi:hypothetical protein
MRSLALHAPPGQPMPNLLLAVVHFLLLQGAEHPLRAFYLSVSEDPDTVHDPYPVFAAFCGEYYDTLRELVATRLIQTNEVGRCACLFPAFEVVSRRTDGLPLALVEIGASAGLNLLWDQYAYTYNGAECGGLADSPVRIECKTYGRLHPPVPGQFPQVSYRAGVDLRPIDVSDPEDVCWLKALIFPENSGRMRLLNQAVELAKTGPPMVVPGNATDVLPDILAEIPTTSALCLFHTFTLNQFTDADRTKLISLVLEVAAQRHIYLLAVEPFGSQYPHLELTALEGANQERMLLAYCHVHGEWLEWLF